MRRAFRSLLLGLAWASIWPAYLVLLAQAARLGPWPRDLGLLCSTLLHGLALGAFVPGVLAWMTRREGWTERFLGVPTPVGRQISRAGRFLAAAAVLSLVPVYLLSSGEFAPDGRPITAAAICRFLIQGFELSVWLTLVSLLRHGSPFMRWCNLEPAVDPVVEGQPATVRNARAMTSRSEPVDREGDDHDGAARSGGWWLSELSRQRRLIGWLVLVLGAGIIALDVRGYRFTARRLAAGSVETLALLALSWALHRGACRIIHQREKRWERPHRALAIAISSAVTLRSGSRARSAEKAASSGEEDAIPETDRPEVLARWLCQLVSYFVMAVAGLGFAWIWELDLAFLRFLASQEVWSVAETAVTLGDLTRSAVFILLGCLAWRFMSPLFALTLFPRIADDPGVRFAVVTLCRYAVLAVTVVAALGAIHVGTAQIGMVLAALGVGLGFGLQEIVSNFVCGIILLLERPIRIGDVVTVSGTTGKVDRINIRATMIISGDNQSMIVPNREFITSNLVNWTHKDKILRITIRVGVAYGSDTEQVVDLLLAIARDDPYVLREPQPSALLEELGDSALKFALFAYVPDPTCIGSVKHRLCAEITRQFSEAKIVIPRPTHEVHLCRVPDDLTRVLDQPRWLSGAAAAAALRLDAAGAIPPAHHLPEATAAASRQQPSASAIAPSSRTVDK
ncbi:MAG: mechanosensitive ion channel family protein [Isosphaeraceae bacterium]